MGNQFGYKKYMKKEARKDNYFLKLFIVTLCGMLLVFTFLIKSFSPNVDVSIGDQQDVEIGDESKNAVDGRLAMIQNEDQGRSFSDLMSKPEDTPQNVHQDVEIDNSASTEQLSTAKSPQKETVSQALNQPAQDAVYKVFVGTYTSAEQAKVAKDIIVESGNGLNPIVKCIGSNNYTLQVGIFKNKASAEALLNTVQQNHLPARIVQDY